MKISNRLDRFLISYKGNKYNETKKYYDLVVPKNINEYDYIVEPFGGIFGFSRAIYERNPDFKGQFIINDVNKTIINLYNILKTNPETIFKDIEEIINLYKDKIDHDLTKYLRALTDEKKVYLKYIFSSIGGCYSTHKGIQKLKNYKEKMELFKNFYDKTIFLNMDCLDLFKLLSTDKKYKNKKILIYHDPPYFDSNNSDYSFINENIYEDNKIKRSDNTQFYIDILDIFKNKKIHSIMILNNVAILNYIFEKYKKHHYEKLYANTITRNKKNYKSHTIHNIFNNN